MLRKEEMKEEWGSSDKVNEEVARSKVMEIVGKFLVRSPC
jgi:hypothetical protein